MRRHKLIGHKLKKLGVMSALVQTSLSLHSAPWQMGAQCVCSTFSQFSRATLGKVAVTIIPPGFLFSCPIPNSPFSLGWLWAVFLGRPVTIINVKMRKLLQKKLTQYYRQSLRGLMLFTHSTVNYRHLYVNIWGLANKVKWFLLWNVASFMMSPQSSWYGDDKQNCL